MQPRTWLDFRKNGFTPRPLGSWAGKVVLQGQSERMVTISTYRFVAIFAFVVGIIIGVMIGAAL